MKITHPIFLKNNILVVFCISFVALLGCTSVMTDVPTTRGKVEVLTKWSEDCKNPKAPERIYGCERIANEVAKKDRIAAIPYAGKACRYAFDVPMKPSLASCALLWNFLDISSMQREDRALAEASARSFLDASLYNVNYGIRHGTAYVLSIRFPDLWASYIEKLFTKKACEQGGIIVDTLGIEAPCERAKRMGLTINSDAYAQRATSRQLEIARISDLKSYEKIAQTHFTPECINSTETSACYAREPSIGTLAGETIAVQLSRSNPALAARYAYAACNASMRSNLEYYCAALWSLAEKPFVDSKARIFAENTAEHYLRTNWRIMLSHSAGISAGYVLLSHFPQLFKKYSAAQPIGLVCEGADDRPKFDEYNEAMHLGESACSRAARLNIEIDEVHKAALAKIDSDYEREARQERAAQRAQDAEFRQHIVDTIVTGVSQTTTQLQHQNAAVAQQQQMILQQQALRDHARIEQRLESAAAVTGTGRLINPGSEPSYSPASTSSSGTSSTNTLWPQAPTSAVSSTCDSRCRAIKTECNAGSQSACYRAAACTCQCFLDNVTDPSPQRDEWRKCVVDNTARADQLRSTVPVFNPTAPSTPTYQPPSSPGRATNTPPCPTNSCSLPAR